MPFEIGPYIFTIASLTDFAPKVPGVYGVSGAVGMIYVGQSEDIYDRLLHHLNDESHCIWKYSPHTFHFEKVLGGKGARRKLVDELIAEYDPPCNKT